MLHDDVVVTELHHGEAEGSFGAKTIGTFSGTMLMINNMMGVGIPLLPNLFVAAGFVTPTLVILLVALFSGLSGTMLTEAMKYVPGNRNFDDRIEYAALCRFYLGKWPYVVTQILLNFSLLSINLVSILLTVQVMDWTIVRIFDCSYGLVIEPNFGFNATCPVVGLCSHNNSPFGDSMVISLGFLVVICLIIPMGYFNLEDNMIIQVISTGIQTLILFEWLVTFFLRGFQWDKVSAFGTPDGQGQVLGQVMINYAFVMTVPSWCNEKRRSSSVNTVVWSAVGISTTFFLLVGIMGALAFPDLGGADILTAINRASDGSLIDQIAVYLFPLIAVASSIPVFSIIIRYNLVENGILGSRWANLLAVVLPWILVIPLTAGNTVFNDVANYTSILFQTPINLIIPFIVYLLAMRRKAYLKPCFCEPGRCEHDEPPKSEPLDADFGVDQTYHMTGEGPSVLAPLVGGSLSASGDNVLTHRHVLGEDGHVHQVNEFVPRKKWSEKNPRCAKCCCRSWVRWKDKPPVNPLAKFSVRHPWLARKLPRKWVVYFDRDEVPAPEHFALPKGMPIVGRQVVAFILVITSTAFLFASLGLSIWQSIEPDAPINCTEPSGRRYWMGK